jgi:hypothetical protein
MNTAYQNFSQCADFMNQKFLDVKLLPFDFHIPQNLIFLTESFLQDVVSTNLYVFQNIQNGNLFSELYYSWALIFVPLCFCLCMIIAYTVRTYFTSFIALLSGEVIVMVALFVAPMTLPWKSQRFYLGLLFFASFLTIHSYVFDKIQKNSKPPTSTSTTTATTATNTDTNNTDTTNTTALSSSPSSLNNNTDESEDNTWLSIYLETALFIRKQHSLSHADPRLSWKRLIYFVVVAFLADFATFIIKEFIPLFIKPSNQYFFTVRIYGIIIIKIIYMYIIIVIYIVMYVCIIYIICILLLLLLLLLLLILLLKFIIHVYIAIIYIGSYRWTMGLTSNGSNLLYGQYHLRSLRKTYSLYLSPSSSLSVCVYI